MRYCEFPPHPRLAPYVRLIWSLELDGAAAMGAPERILPDGLVEAVFHWATPFAQRFDGDAAAIQPRSLVVSQTRRYLEIWPTGRSGFMSVRFHRWGGYHFFAQPVAAFADRAVSSRDLWGPPVAALEEALAAARDAPARAVLLRRFLLDRLARHYKPEHEALIRAVWRAQGVSVAALCRDLGVGERRLERVLKAATGLPPKRLLALSRFLRACGAIKHTPAPTLTALAHGSGYYDQSHLIHEFKTFSGMTPREFAAASGVVCLDVD
jgi:AraC-like DNA-binding protein